MTSRPLLVGITGHRIVTEISAIWCGITEALRRVATAYPARPLVVLSSLAEGADRMAAEAVLRQPGSELIAVLPFPREEYSADFGADGLPSRVHFEELLARTSEVVELPPCRTRDQGYEQSGLYILARADLILAVWDGNGAQGQGGTGEMVERARAAGKPLLIVRAGNRAPGTNEPTTLGPDQGKVIAERLPN